MALSYDQCAFLKQVLQDIPDRRIKKVGLGDMQHCCMPHIPCIVICIRGASTMIKSTGNLTRDDVCKQVASKLILTLDYPRMRSRN